MRRVTGEPRAGDPEPRAQRRGPAFIRRFAVSLSRRYSAWKTYVWASGLGCVFLLVVGGIDDSRTLLGIPGSGVSLIVIAAAVLAGPGIGIGVAVTLTAAFYALIAQFGSVSAPVGAVLGSLIWVLAALFTGLVADAMRSASSERDELREQRRLFELLEAGLLPGRPFTHPGMGVITRYMPSEQRMRLGGDFLDVRRAGDHEIAFILGDVAGHGPVAAALSATMRAVWQGLVLSRASQELIVRSLNEVVWSEASEECPFATAVFGWLDLDAGELAVVYAGHPPVLLVGETARPLSRPPHLPLGVEEVMEPTVHRVRLEPPCTVFAYTDGLVDAPMPRLSGVPAEQWLLDRVYSLRSCLTDESIDRLIGEALGDAGDPRDDIAVLALCVSERRGAAAAAVRATAGDRRRGD